MLLVLVSITVASTDDRTTSPASSMVIGEERSGLKVQFTSGVSAIEGEFGQKFNWIVSKISTAEITNYSGEFFSGWIDLALHVDPCGTSRRIVIGTSKQKTQSRLSREISPATTRLYFDVGPQTSTGIWLALDGDPCMIATDPRTFFLRASVIKTSWHERRKDIAR